MAWTIKDKTVLITGGNTGIGKATAIELAQQGARVVITSRDAERGHEAIEEIRRESGSDAVEMMALDLASFASIREFARDFLDRHAQLDVFIANAGVSIVRSRQETFDGFELSFGVNHLGHFELTRLLLDRIKDSAPARIIVLSSGGYAMARDGLDWDDLQHKQEYHGFNVYGHSKLANIYFTRELAKRLEGTGVTVNAVHPGYVETQLGRARPEDIERFKANAAKSAPVNQPAPPAASGGAKPASTAPQLDMEPLSPRDGAFTSVYLAVAPEVEGVTGEYYAEGKLGELNPVGADMEAAARLWQVSEELTAQVP